MPNRILREGILTSEPVNSLSWQAEVFYRRLMSVIDDFGRYYAKPALLRAACYPLQLEKVDDTDVVRMLVELTNSTPALVEVYEVDGKQYLQLLKFRQQVRAKASRFPDPPITCTASAKQMRGNGAADAHLDGDVSVDVGGVVFEDVLTLASQGGENRPVSTPACPHEKIIEAYHRHLPMGRQVNLKVWNGTRKQHLQARWREDRERQSVEWWDKFFAYCSRSNFLTGKIAPRQGRDPFLVSLDWIVSPSNFAKIIEGAYER